MNVLNIFIVVYVKICSKVRRGISVISSDQKPSHLGQGPSRPDIFLVVATTSSYISCIDFGRNFCTSHFGIEPPKSDSLTKIVRVPIISEVSSRGSLYTGVNCMADRTFTAISRPLRSCVRQYSSFSFSQPREDTMTTPSSFQTYLASIIILSEIKNVGGLMNIAKSS